MAWKPRTWASAVPLGLGTRKPHHILGMAARVWENRDRLPYAMRILNNGVCDGCALGTTGMNDWTMDGIHLCMVRLDLLRLNTMSAFDPAILHDVESLSDHDSDQLRALGRLPTPMIRRQGEPGFQPIPWDDALDLVAQRCRDTDRDRLAFYLTSRGIPNETYYVAQKVTRFLGSPHVDNSARLCHAASTSAMKEMLGHGASTGSYRDWLETDLIVFFGSNTANNQPVTIKYLYYAKKQGTEIAIVNPYREPGMKHYWVPSVPESAVFGTKLADHWYEVDTGGDLAFLNGVLKALLARDAIDHAFIAEQTEDFETLRASIDEQSWERLEAASGTDRARMEAFAELLIAKPNAIFVWSMGLTQHTHGVDTLRALCNVGLARGLVGRPKRGLTPIRGHSGVQGGAEVGAVPVADGPILDRWADVWGFEPPREPGMATMAQLDAAAAGELDVFWIMGGNFLETVPGDDRNRQALARPGLRIHQDIVLNRSMLVDPEDTVLLLPATTRYEIAGGVTETSTERRIIFSPEVPGPRVADARDEWRVLCDLAERVDPARAEQIRFADTAAIRAEIARAIPLYSGIENLAKKGDQMQWGGPTLYADGRFATADGKAHFSAVEPPTPRAVGTFRVSTRRGKQFNSMVHAEVDPLNGAAREAILMNRRDAKKQGLRDGDAIRLVSEHGAFTGHVMVSPIKGGNLAVHWPEAMNLLDGAALDPESGEPDYNVDVTLEVPTGS
ncbi:MAG: FdhF/YdeP family oxidoreductase [Acidobacteriota bacterium]